MVELGHVVFYVRNLEASLKFYHETVGLDLKGKIFKDRAAVLTGGRTHHELLLIEVGDKAEGPLEGFRVGLYHVGWKIGNSLDELIQMRDSLIEKGYEIDGQSDHTVSFSLYLRDPDGNEVELYVDNPDVDWKKDSSWMSRPIKRLFI